MWNYRTEPCLMGWQQGNKPQALPVPDEHSNCWEVDWEGKPAAPMGSCNPEARASLRTADAQTHRPGDICLETFAGRALR
jgi:hypothetical protein